MWANENKAYKINVDPFAALLDRLLVNISNVHGILHDLDPALKRGYLKQGQEARRHVVEVNFRVLPLHARLGQTLSFVAYSGVFNACCAGDTFVEQTLKQCHTYDAEYEPKNHAHNENVEYGRYRVDKWINHSLNKWDIYRFKNESETSKWKILIIYFNSAKSRNRSERS